MLTAILHAWGRADLIRPRWAKRQLLRRQRIGTLGASDCGDLCGLLGDERVEAVVGSKAGLPVDLALDGLKLGVVPCRALLVAPF